MGRWKRLTERLGDRIQLVGDDVFVTNTKILKQGIRARGGKLDPHQVNQIGTLTETRAADRHGA